MTQKTLTNRWVQAQLAMKLAIEVASQKICVMIEGVENTAQTPPQAQSTQAK